MEDYSPIPACRDSLPEMIANMLRGLSLLPNEKSIVAYSNSRVEHGRIGLTDVCNVFCDLSITRDDNGRYTKAERSNIWLASIPRPNDNGIFSIQGRRYYTVMRMRLIPNSPMCRIRTKADKLIVECSVRSENMETLESTYCVMRRSTRNPYNLVLCPRVRDTKPIAVISMIRTLLDSFSSWENTATTVCNYLGASETILTMVQSYYPLAKDIVITKCYFPSTLNPNNGSKYYTVINGSEISTDVIVLCHMMVKYLRLECGQIPEDNRDDYTNCVVDSYSVMMCKLLRKNLRILGTGVMNKQVEGLPRIYTPLIEAITRDEWEVMSKKDTDLKVSRQVNTHNSLGLLEATRELLVYASPMVSGEDEDIGYTRRLLHPSQDGFVCKVRTSDDINAGLKMYLAADCRVSMSCKMFNDDADDNMILRSMYYEDSKEVKTKDTTSNMLWLHNHRVIGVVDKDICYSLLTKLKQSHEQLCWSITDGIIETRHYYGRLLRTVYIDKLGKTLLDTRMIPMGNVVMDSSRYSRLCYEVPFYNMMPVPRCILSTKIVQKAVSYEMRADCMDNSLHLAYGQLPLVTTTKSSTLIYGTNVFVCYTTLKGIGVEDGIILNKCSVERGLFSTIHHMLVEWDKRDDLQVRSYSIDIDRYSQIKQGRVIFSVVCIKGNGEETTYRIKHDKPFVCYIEDVVLSFCNDSSLPKDLLSIKAMLVRYKRIKTGDKLSSRYGQKAVVVKMLPPESMPQIESLGYPAQPDIVVNPLSMLSRATMSQDISSTLGAIVLEQGARCARVEPFSSTYIVTGRVAQAIDLDEVSGNYSYVSDGDTGLAYDTPAKIGFEYYLVLDHIADNKCRVTGPSRRDDMTGAIVSSTHETSIRYNWQELSAMLHSKSYKLLSEVYNNIGVRGTYPFCTICNRDVDAWSDNRCEYCGTIIDTKVQLSKPFAISKRLMQCIGVDCYVSV